MPRHRRTTPAACALSLALLLAGPGGAAGLESGRGAEAAGREARVGQRRQRRRVPRGSWGGQGVRLEVGGRGAEVEFDCAHGTTSALALDASGRFDVAGTFVREHGGPVRHGEEPEQLPARYAGRVEGTEMTLRVVVEGLDETLTFTLTRGRDPQLHKCL